MLEAQACRRLPVRSIDTVGKYPSHCRKPMKDVEALKSTGQGGKSTRECGAYGAVRQS